MLRAAGVAAEEQPVGVPRLGEVGDQREDRRVGPVLRAAGAVELQRRAGRRRLGVLARVGVAVDVGEDDRRGGTPSAASRSTIAKAHRPVLRVDAHGCAGPRVRGRRGLERPSSSNGVRWW